MVEQSRAEPGRRKAEVESGQLETKVELEAWRTGVNEVELRDQRTKEELAARKTEVEPREWRWRWSWRVGGFWWKWSSGGTRCSHKSGSLKEDRRKTDQGGDGRIRDPSEAGGMTGHSGVERARNHGWTDGSRPGVSKFGPREPQSCRVQLQP